MNHADPAVTALAAHLRTHSNQGARCAAFARDLIKVINFYNSTLNPDKATRDMLEAIRDDAMQALEGRQ